MLLRTLTSLLLAALVSAKHDVDCGDCSCTLLSEVEHTLELNCSSTGNDASSVGRQVLIPTVDLSNVTANYVWAYFRHNNITKVQILNNLDLVSKLYLDYNDIDVVYDNAFTNVGRTLTDLSLAHNKLREIRPKVFSILKRLQVLDLSYNRLTVLNVDDLNLKDSLKTLVLANNQISVIKNSGAKDLTSLQELDLSGNQLVKIDRDNFKKLDKLTTLNLSNNKLLNLEVGSTVLPGLKSLDVSFNILKDESVFGARMRGLKTLHIGNNSIVNLKKVMDAFPNIQELHIPNNKVLDVPTNINLGSLRVLNISGNSLDDIPHAAFSELLVLDVSYNDLKAVPKEINGIQMPLLRWLSLDGNPLKTVQFSTTGAPFSDLQVLSLSHMDTLQEVGEEAFSWVVSPQSGYTGLNLTIAHNPHLAVVHKKALMHAEPLNKLDLSYNALTSLPMELVAWENISTVNLQGNPWNCLCSLQWMVDEVVTHIYEKGDRRLLIDLKCASPAMLRDRRLAHYYNSKTPALCGDAQRMGRMRQAVEPEIEISTGSSEGMLIAVSVVGTLFIVLVIAGVVVHIRSRNRRRAKNRRLN